MKVYLIRHGQSIANKEYIIQGHFDSPLSEVGKQQARNLQNILPEFDRVYSSPLRRVVETAQLGLNGKKPPIVKRDELKEIYFGNYEGFNGYDIDDFDLDRFRSFARFIEDTYLGRYNFETHSNFHKRISNAFDKIISETVDDPNFNRIAIFAHGGVLRSILQFHLELESQETAYFKNTEVVVLTYENSIWSHKRLTGHIRNI